MGMFIWLFEIFEESVDAIEIDCFGIFKDDNKIFILLAARIVEDLADLVDGIIAVGVGLRMNSFRK